MGTFGGDHYFDDTQLLSCHQADDMPFAVDDFMPAGVGGAAAGTSSSSSSVLSMRNEASFVASMCSITPKRLSMFEKNKNHTTSTTTTTTNSNESSHQVSSLLTTTSSAMPQEQQHSCRSPAVDDVTVDVDVSAAAVQTPKVDSLIDQLAEFKSFGASLMTSTT